MLSQKERDHRIRKFIISELLKLHCLVPNLAGKSKICEPAAGALHGWKDVATLRLLCVA